MTKIQDTFHEELVHIEQEVDTEDVPEGETFEGPSYEDFTQKDSADNDDNLDFKPLYSGVAITVGLSALLHDICTQTYVKQRGVIGHANPNQSALSFSKPVLFFNLRNIFTTLKHS